MLAYWRVCLIWKYNTKPLDYGVPNYNGHGLGVDAMSRILLQASVQFGRAKITLLPIIPTK